MRHGALDKNAKLWRRAGQSYVVRVAQSSLTIANGAQMVTAHAMPVIATKIATLMLLPITPPAAMPANSAESSARLAAHSEGSALGAQRCNAGGRPMAAASERKACVASTIAAVRVGVPSAGSAKTDVRGSGRSVTSDVRYAEVYVR